MGFLVDENSPVVWRGLMVRHHMLTFYILYCNNSLKVTAVILILYDVYPGHVSYTKALAAGGLGKT